MIRSSNGLNGIQDLLLLVWSIVKVKHFLFFINRPRIAKFGRRFVLTPFESQRQQAAMAIQAMISIPINPVSSHLGFSYLFPLKLIFHVFSSFLIARIFFLDAQGFLSSRSLINPCIWVYILRNRPIIVKKYRIIDLLHYLMKLLYLHYLKTQGFVPQVLKQVLNLSCFHF